ncbi:nucleotide exchange factor GrpE [Nocardia vinacea]|uniref:nucleotide exchange factor GrpE n=1 Tax=Nocardia vinacea TaxID=96468 RepID=UPI00030F5BFB|nr:nucleotide exchange factor GrpE [Nocardia vinacea]
MTDPAEPHPEDPTTPAAPQVEVNPIAPHTGHPTGPRTPPLESLTSPIAPQAGNPAKPLTPWADTTTSQAASRSGHLTDPAAPQAETSATPAPQTGTHTDPSPPAGDTADPLAPQIKAPAAPQIHYPANSRAPQLENPTDPLAHLAERIEDLTRVIARQATTIDRLADEAKARDRRDRSGADLPLVLELFALHADSTACAATAESPRERAAFEAVATRIERLIAGRGGTLVTPRPDDAFDSLTMEAADVAKTDDPALDRTVESVVQSGLTVAGRSVRPAGVVVRRHH